MTRKESYELIINILMNTDEEDMAMELVNFCEKEINAIDTKAEKAKERIAKKKAEPDKLTDAIVEVLTSGEGNGQFTVNALVKELGGYDVGTEVTNQKVVSRLSKLVAAGNVEKSNVKEGDRYIRAYSWAVVEEEAAVEEEEVDVSAEIEKMPEEE